MARMAKPILTPDMVVVPIPLHFYRLLQRRYNQSALLAQALAREAGLVCCPDALIRPNHTPSLDGKSREERFTTLSGALALHRNRGQHIVGKPVLLVDDVMTSGATLAAAAEVCLAAGAREVCIIVLARVAKDT
jgi:ComF family protein